jgi:hypothetical protein
MRCCRRRMLGRLATAAAMMSEQEGTTMDRYEVELEPAEPKGFAAVVPALPGLLVSAETLTRSSNVSGPPLRSTSAVGRYRSNWLSAGRTAASCSRIRRA